MRYFTFFCLILLFSVSCNNDKGSAQKAVSNSSIILLANNGFNDTSGSGSSANVHNTASLTHDNVNSGYFHCYFYDSIYYKHDPGKDSTYLPQLAITLANLQPRMFSVTIDFTQMNLEDLKDAKFVFVGNSDNEKYDTSSAPVDANTRFVKLDSLFSGTSHIYYLNVFGICRNKNLSFDVSDIKVSYINSMGK